MAPRPFPCQRGSVERRGAMHLDVELLRTADGRLEGTVATDWGWERSFSGTLDLLRILEELEPLPDDPPTPRRPG